MKKTKLILLLFTIAVFTAAIALLVGCDNGGIRHEYDYMVVFDYNVDKLGVATNCETQYLGVDAGKTVIAPGSNNKFKTFTVTNFYNEGWYTAKTDADGNPVKDADGNIVLDKKWNFDTDVVNGNMTLYANFHRNPTFTVRVDGANDIVISKEPTEQYDRPVANSGKPQKKDWTFIDYYTDDTYTTKFEFPYDFSNGDGECYALMLEGTWDIVTNASTFRSALEQGHSMYFEVPSGVIDLGKTYFRTGQFNKNYSGKIYGHDCVLKNINISTSFNRDIKTYSLFGNIDSKAEIHDLTFENLTFTVTGLNAVPEVDIDNFKIALFATDIDSGAKFENIEFKDCELNYNDATSSNLTYYGYYVTISQDADYGCFDMSNLTVKRDGNAVELN